MKEHVETVLAWLPKPVLVSILVLLGGAVVVLADQVRDLKTTQEVAVETNEAAHDMRENLELRLRYLEQYHMQQGARVWDNPPPVLPASPPEDPSTD